MTEPAQTQPIAIVGIGCRFPGGADSPAAFWQLLMAGRDAVVDVPPDRWNSRRFYDPDPDTPGKTTMRRGGFLQEPVDQFDARFFGISPREAEQLDPQQGLLLETTWEALEDAGCPAESLAGTPVGVFIGGFTLDNKIHRLSPLNRYLVDSQTPAGLSMTMLANRISHVFDFRGPSVTMDTACSSSLVAFDQACRSLRQGQCEVALVGGVNVMFRPEYAMLMSKGLFLSADGRCKAFDERADGYGRGEGAGVVVLKPLDLALADGDRIYAVVRATGVNQDGRTPGITLPNGDAQQALLKSVYAEAGIDPAQVQYVEAHGTGTQAGDATEAAAIGAVMGAGRPADRPCLVGALKTNIGHLEAAAGVASVIKAALCLYHSTIPPNLHFETPNPAISFEDLRIKPVTQTEPWPETQKTRLAGVNGFGYGGTNAHAVLAGYDARREKDSVERGKETVLALSARSAAALTVMAGRYIDVLTADDSADLTAICWSTAHRRSHHPHRLAFVSDTANDATAQLRRYIEEGDASGVPLGHISATEPRSLTFVYTGMGPQQPGMGSTLLVDEPVFREAVAQCDAVFQPLAGWSLIDAMTADETVSRMVQPEVAQPANFALQIGLTALWRAWGVTPAAVVGHSVGEVAAAYVAGALSLEDAVRVSYHRSRVQQTVHGKGRMLMAAIPEYEAWTLIDGHEDRVSIAAVNSRSSVTLSGDPALLETMAADLGKTGVFNRLLDVEVAYHSVQMTPLEADFRAALSGLTPEKPALPLYSTVTGAPADAAMHDTDYWWANVREPVRFADAMDTLIGDRRHDFLEIGPHPVLATDIRQALTMQQIPGHVYHSLHRRKSERTALLETVAGLYVGGHKTDWTRCIPAAAFTDLPLYPWQRTSYYLESDRSRADRIGTDDHPLSGGRMRTLHDLWESDVDAVTRSWLKDHCIGASPVFPGAAYIEMALILYRHIYGERPAVIENIAFSTALATGGTVLILQTTCNRDEKSWSVGSASDTDRTAWTLHAAGRLTDGNPGPQAILDIENIRSRCTSERTATEIYARFETLNLHYGPAFRGIVRLQYGPEEALADLALPPVVSEDAAMYRLHPVLLDAGFQALLAAADEVSETYIPISIDRVLFYQTPPEQATAYARLTRRTADTIIGDVTICDAAGRVCAAVSGVHCRALPVSDREHRVSYEDRLYDLEWREAEPESSLAVLKDSEPPWSGTWLLADNGSETGQALAAAIETDGRLIRTPMPAAAMTVDAWESCMETAGQALRGVVFISDQTTVDEDDLVKQSIDACTALTALIQVSGPRDAGFRLAIMTRHAQQVLGEEAISPGAAALWGLGRVIRSEYPAMDCRLIDFDDLPECLQPLRVAALGDHAEDEIAVRNGMMHVHRLTRLRADTDFEMPRRTLAPDDDIAYELKITQPGMMDSLGFRAFEKKPPGNREIEIEVHVTPLGFKDVMKAMDMLHDSVINQTFFDRALGMECAGIVRACGADVQTFRPGDRVLATADGGCFRSTITISPDRTYVIPIPDNVSLEDATGVVAYMTVIHGLRNLAHLSGSDRILIHAATGGVGLTAVQYAMAVGAEIFATAGSDEKRDYLRTIGVPHVMDSRTLAFADEIMKITDGHGVDVVLNSLSGDMLAKSLAVLAPYGRFIEIGKKDIMENNSLHTRAFNRNLTFTAVDIDRILTDNRSLAWSLIEDYATHMKQGDFKPLPLSKFPAAEANEAFRYMAQSRHIGQVAVSMCEKPDSVRMTARDPVIPDAAYLITGGLGGLGLHIAANMAGRGARHLVLAGRSGVATAGARDAVDALAAAGVQVQVIKADVSKPDQVTALLAEIQETMPPLRGIIHAAGVLDDGWLTRLDRAAFERVMSPKAVGAWHLHRATRRMPLDFFICCSSISAVTGNPGQGAYAAANTFLDALAQHRRQSGLPALSIQWGAIADTGMIAGNPDAKAHLEQQGVSGITPEEALETLEFVMQRDVVRLGIAEIDWTTWAETNPALARSPRFTACVEAPVHRDGGLLAELRTLNEAEQLARLEEIICEHMGRVLKSTPGEIDRHRALTDLGLDSLMSIELITALRTALDIELSAMDLISGVTIHQLTRRLHNQFAATVSAAAS